MIVSFDLMKWGITEKNVQQLFSEARYCTSYGAFTAEAMLCRKILMHVAVSLGAKPDQTFKVYVDSLGIPGATGRDERRIAAASGSAATNPRP